MAFASEDIGYGNGERINDLDLLTKNKEDNYPTTTSYTTWGGAGKTTTNRALRNYFPLRKESEGIS